MKLLDQVSDLLLKGHNCSLSGLNGSCRAFFIAELLARVDQLFLLTGREEQAYDIAHALRGFLRADSILVLPTRDVLSPLTLSQANAKRMMVLGELAQHPHQKRVVIASAPALMWETVSPARLNSRIIRVQAKSRINVDKLLIDLVEAGYERYPVVDNPGQFGVRGGIIDIFPIDAREPVRLELFGDEVESIRCFSPHTQLSHGKVEMIGIIPAHEDTGDGARVWDYLAHGPIWVDEPVDLSKEWAACTRRFRKFLRQTEQEQPAAELKNVEWEAIEGFLNSRAVVYHSFFPRSFASRVELLEHITQREGEPFWARPGSIIAMVKDWQTRGFRTIFALPDKTREEHLRKELAEAGIASGVEFARWSVDKGFVSSTLRVALVSEKDLIGKKATRSAVSSKAKPVVMDNLHIGDFVVHESHGIGEFRGVTRLEVDGTWREYLIIQYAGTDRLYLPADKVNLLTRYSGGEGREPRLSKLGSSDWERTKKRVKESIRELAGELLELYAAREKAAGHSFAPDTVWQREFEEGFEYEETPDQARAVIEVKRDMERHRPMDRLVCGDVGYGKTEVAMRAAFKAVMENKQVAVLVPTTILAEQHYQTFRQRFSDYPVIIEVLSRFKKPSQIKRIREDLERGVVDIIIGTHRLLSRDIKFFDLGLLVIDEEHRFGVRQKERIKTLKETVDVISLSATPIPRTLHMALTGLRDLSVIETPPPERYPITTYVMEYNPEMVREAVLEEVERKGQVFFVHNRINDIERVKGDLEKLLPEIRIDVAHGRMDEMELAEVMNRFMAGESDMLLCTTIIESGLDLPNVNTLIVDEADRMGLAQLYQIRGRVGRTNRIAFSYLTYRPDKVITENAQKRLNAIREFTELGSGMRIALRDLEIRGAGNILGPEQHGYIEAVGFDLYCRLLEEETARSRGQAIIQEREVPQIDIKVDSYIPDDYIDDPGLKVQVYRQAMLAQDPAEVADMERELLDRFGPIPLPTQNLLRISKLRLQAQGKRIKYINTNNRQIELGLEGPLGNQVEGLFRWQEKYGFKISVTHQNTLVLKTSKGLTLEALEDLLASI